MIKKVLSNFHRYLLWLLICVMVWAWIFTMMTDTSRAKKVTVLISSPAVSEYALSEKLEETKPEGIKLIKARPMSYEAIRTGSSSEADIFIVPESELIEHIEELSEITCFDGFDSFVSDGKIYGVLAFDPETGIGAASGFITYAVPGAEAERYYICFNKDSMHIGDLNDSKDDAAIKVALDILALR